MTEEYRDKAPQFREAAPAGTTGTAPREAPRKKESYVKASARFVARFSRSASKRSQAGRAAVPSGAFDCPGSSAPSSPASSSAVRSPTAPGFSLASIIAALALCTALLGIGASAASAAPTATTAYSYLTSFGAGEIDDSSQTLNAYPANALAVDQQTGNILYADDYSKEQVVVFSPDPIAGGTFLTALSAGWQSAIATDPDSGALYTQELSEFTTGAIQRFTSDGQPTPSYTVDPSFSRPTSGAANFAIDPTTHEILAVAPGGLAVERIASDGSVVASFSTPGGTGIRGRRAIAVGLDGTVYMDGASGKILRFGPDGTRLPDFTINLEVGDKVQDPGIDVEPLVVNPTSGAVSILVKTTKGRRIVTFSPSGTMISDIPAQTGTSKGLAIDATSGRLYSFNRDTVSIDTYVPEAYAGVEAPVFSALTPTSVHVSTEVDPGEKVSGGGLPAGSGVRFEYRTQGDAAWTQTTDQAVSAPGTFGTDIEGLEPNTTYEIRAVAFNDYTAHASDSVTATTVATAPVVSTSSATDVSETSAVLNGTINPVGIQSTYYFEYGLTSSYGSRIPLAIDGVAGGTHEVKSFGRTIHGLIPGTTYHFHIVATNSVGTTEGDDNTFTTAKAASTPKRSYEQVSPADKEGNALWPTFGFQAEANGNGFSFQWHGGSLSSPIHAQTMSLRGSDDWNGGIDLDPPNNTPASLFFNSTLAISKDFTHTLVVSNRALGPGAVENGANLYVVDTDNGALELVAATNAIRAFSALTGTTTGDAFVAGAPDFSWVVFFSPKPLVSGAPLFALYRWSEADGLEVVSRLPGGEMVSPVNKSINSGVYNQVSTDGNRIYFSVTGGPEPGLYLREGDSSKAISISEVSGEPTGPQPALLLDITKDGRYAFFSALDGGIKLTSDAKGDPGDLYRYDASSGDLEYLGASAISLIVGDLEGGTRTVYTSLGTDPDGSILYFNLRTGENNASALAVWNEGDVHPISPGLFRAPEVVNSPNGRYVGFYDDGAIRLYDSVTEELSCASCLADGTPVPGGIAQELSLSNQEGEAVSDDGTVYFDTRGRLVAADVNGTSDVYGYHAGQAFLVSPGNAPFDASFAGITEGGRDVFFTTAQSLVGRDGDEAVDVYDARIEGGLSAQNRPAPQECLRDDCKATPAAGPELPFGGSEALNGPGNVTGARTRHCAKSQKSKKVKGKRRCVKSTRSKKPHKHASAKRGQAR